MTESDLKKMMGSFDVKEKDIFSYAANCLTKASRKLAQVHARIDLYDDREDLHDEHYWLSYLLDPEWSDADIDWFDRKENDNA